MVKKKRKKPTTTKNRKNKRLKETNALKKSLQTKSDTQTGGQNGNAMHIEQIVRLLRVHVEREKQLRPRGIQIDGQVDAVLGAWHRRSATPWPGDHGHGQVGTDLCNVENTFIIIQ